MITTLCAAALLAAAVFVLAGCIPPRPYKTVHLSAPGEPRASEDDPSDARVRLTWSGDVSARKLFLEAEFLESCTASIGIGCNECHLF